MFKKKYPFGLSVLLVLLFTMLFVTFSTCYAEYDFWTLDDTAYFEWYYDYLLENADFGTQDSRCKGILQGMTKTYFGQQLYSFWNTAMTTNGWGKTRYNNCALYPEFHSYSPYFQIHMFLFNAGSPGGLELGHLYLWANEVYGVYPGTGSIYELIITLNTDSTITSNGSFQTISTTYSGSSFKGTTFNDDGTIVYLRNLGFAGIPSGYTKYPLTNGSPRPIIFSSINGNFTPSVPEEPSGDSPISGDSNTGTITNPSGDVTGSIDLSGIENGISQVNENLNNIENKIPTSGDIQNAVGQVTENYWGSSGDLTGDEQEQAISENINNMMSELSGEFAKNEAFVELENAENGFLDLFRNHSDEPNFYDLAFEWNDFQYQGVTLIPAGSVNISQMCRDNIQLGYIQSLIRIIFNFEVAITLIYQVWNLILSTLGIDNPYLYENYNEVDRLDPTTGEVRTTLFRRRRHLK